MENETWMNFATFTSTSQKSSETFYVGGGGGGGRGGRGERCQRNAVLAPGLYKNIVLMRDINMRPTDSNFQAFCENHDLNNLIKEKTCFKSIEGTCIDLILTNQKYSFKNTCTIDTGVSDFHRMVLTQFKITFQKLPPKDNFISSL